MRPIRQVASMITPSVSVMRMGLRSSRPRLVQMVRCSGGSCTDLCSKRSQQSYDGCVFFAVGLPNSKEADIYTDPYAVSPANPHDFEVAIRITGQVIDPGSAEQCAGANERNQYADRYTIGRNNGQFYVADADGARRTVSGPVDNIRSRAVVSVSLFCRTIRLACGSG